MNRLFFGDCLEVLRRHLTDECVDLIYLDPPFNSQQSYNVLFRDRTGEDSPAQIRAFEDTWHWDRVAAEEFDEIVSSAPALTVVAVSSLRELLGTNDMMAYLTRMALRLQELYRVLKPNGSIYLHCDPTASHYLKIILDAIFGARFFRSEIVWKRTSAHSDTKQGRKLHGHIHDIIFFYTKSDDWTWNPLYTDYDSDYVEQFYRYQDDEGRRYRMGDLTAARPGGDTEYLWRVKRPIGGEWQSDLHEEHLTPKRDWEYKGVPPYRGRYWAYSYENMVQYARENRIEYTGTGMPNYKRFLDEMPGVPLQDLWTDIRPLSSRSAERLGYPTQKPEALLDRIVQSSSNPGDIVLDPFCGCGTAIASAQKLEREWIGIDITHLAVTLIRHRLNDTFGPNIEFEVHGEPETTDAAQVLAVQDRHEFELWCIGRLGARPTGKGADQGIDGLLFFRDDLKGPVKKVVISVKSGKVKVGDIRDLKGVVDRETAAIGVYVTLEQPTKPMRVEATASGFYQSPWGKKYPKIQIITIDEMLGGRTIEMPPLRHVSRTFRRPPTSRDGASDQAELPLSE